MKKQGHDVNYSDGCERAAGVTDGDFEAVIGEDERGIGSSEF